MPGPAPGETAEGLLEVMSSGHGFLRRKENSYLPSTGDIFVPANSIRNTIYRSGTLLRGARFEIVGIAVCR